MSKTQMNEKQWVKTICNMLIEYFGDEKYYIDVEVPLSFSCNLNNSFELVRNNKNSKIRNIEVSATAQTWNVDLFIGEKIDNKVIPRVIIEGKYKSVNLHEPITYNYNAGLHKQLHPGLRYGFMLGNYGYKEQDSDIPKQLVAHGNNFDFVFIFNKEILTDEEKEKFIKAIEDNIDKARQLEKFLTETKNKNRKKYWYITKNIEFSEDDEYNV